jgi:hypothetical protein
MKWVKPFNLNVYITELDFQPSQPLPEKIAKMIAQGLISTIETEPRSATAEKKIKLPRLVMHFRERLSNFYTVKAKC